jgi:5-methylcytosine-specific restriction endonuclease McrA
MPYKDPEKKREHSRKWAAAKRADPAYLERIRANNRRSAKRYRMAHPDRAAEWERDGKGRWTRAMQSADGTVTSELITFLLDTPLCPYCCEQMTRDTATIDHIEPISRGGAHTADNLAAVCASCNQSKHAMPLVAFLLRLAGPPRQV